MVIEMPFMRIFPLVTEGEREGREAKLDNQTAQIANSEVVFKIFVI